MTRRAVGLGAMRLSTAPDRPDEAVAIALLEAAIAEGVTLVDTAHAYGLDDDDLGHNERLLAHVLHDGVEVVTKVGMRRPSGRWVPDGRRRTILAQAEASAEALGRVPNAVLLHAVDRATDLATSVRALAEVLERGLARSIGLSNVRYGELALARELAPITTVELAIGPFEDEAVRAGVVERCLDDGVRVLAHSPLGGPARSPRLKKHAVLRAIAEAHHASPGTIALAWLYGLRPGLVPIPGARRIETALAAARAPAIELAHEERARLDEAFPIGRLLRVPIRDRRVEATDREVVLLVGIPGAGKTTAARAWVERGYERLSRDEMGGTLSKLARTLSARLEGGTNRLLLDATYATRAKRQVVLDTAWRHGASVRCVFLDTPLGQAQVNAVERILDRHGVLLGPEAIEAAGKKDPNVFAPRVQFRFRDTLEPPEEDEGFTEVVRVPFERARREGHDRAGLVCDVAALERVSPSETRPVLVLAWRPKATEEELAALRASVPAAFSLEVCVHPAGPALCWCRGPLPGHVVAWMRRERVDPSASRYVGVSSADATLAARLGMDYEDAAP
ncbi:MAG: aldo/keto reductase [Myxococcales bacterium]|nr:aldo/keto reductase [Myxococcales bacterium]